MGKKGHLTFEKGHLIFGGGVRPHPTHSFRYATENIFYLILRNVKFWKDGSLQSLAIFESLKYSSILFFS